MGGIKTFEQRLEGKWYEAERLTGWDSGCHIWTGTKNSEGYGELRFGRHMRKVHRLRYAHTYGPIPDWLLCCHKCNVRECINPEHIYLGTDADNTRDKIDAGTHLIRARGRDHHNTPLEEADVLEIRRLDAAGSTRAEVARRYNVTTATIGNIVNRKTWRHI